MRKKNYPIFFFVLLGVLSASGAFAAKYWEFPPLPESHEYGNILINRTSEKNDMKPVSFSHWSHRAKFTCRVCHFELAFAFATNKTEITEKDNRNGLFCGACHDDGEVFGHTDENCGKCHTGQVGADKKNFEELAVTLPKTRYGNRIDWTRAVSLGKITPKYSIYRDHEMPIPFKRTLELEAEWTLAIPPAYFPHETHIQWLDCANCHPDIFNVQKKSTKHFSMEYILERKFCGVCHLTVAFPIDDCTGCHPKIRNQ